MPHDLRKHNQVKRLYKTYKTKMKREKLITLMASVSNQKWWPHTWTTFKFGCLFSGSELTQQVIIRKIWNDDTREWRSAQDQLSLDWANVGKYRGVVEQRISKIFFSNLETLKLSLFFSAAHDSKFKLRADFYRFFRSRLLFIIVIC